LSISIKTIIDNKKGWASTTNVHFALTFVTKIDANFVKNKGHWNKAAWASITNVHFVLTFVIRNDANI
jgi:hypothetical protein